MRVLLVLACCLLGSVSAHAGLESGNQLLEHCESQNNLNQGVCWGFIAAIVDGEDFDNAANKRCEWFALPKMPMSQIRDVVVKYLKENPEYRHYDAFFLVRDALVGAFPCPK